MNIYFRNQSDKRIILTLNGIVYFLPSGADDILQIDGTKVKMSLTTEDEYSFETFSEKRGMTLYHRFITVAHYSFELKRDSEISLKVETVRGNNLESYQRVVATLKGGFLPEAYYTVKDEDSVRNKLRYDEQKLDKFDKKTEKWSKVLGVGMWLDDAFTVICGIFLGLILLGILIGLLITFPIPTIIVLSVILVVGALSWKIIKKVFNFAFKSFDKLLDRHGEKIGESIAPCNDMPEGIFKDDNSYFDNEYISAVFKHSTRRK
ncbi:MAG: hypothetical protein IJW86_08475 [Clostridia bacterium]|nr:hypothetical protein [Clostridia bacterium]